MTRVTRQLEYYKLQLKYPENIIHNSRRASYILMFNFAFVIFFCNRELRRWPKIVRLTGSKARQCERGCCKQNAIKSHFAQKVEPEEPWCSYAGFSLWTWSLCNGLSYHLQHLEKHARPKDVYARLIKILVTSQDCILLIQNISFPKVLCKHKLKWHLRIKCRCWLTFILVF